MFRFFVAGKPEPGDVLKSEEQELPNPREYCRSHAGAAKSSLPCISAIRARSRATRKRARIRWLNILRLVTRLCWEKASWPGRQVHGILGSLLSMVDHVESVSQRLDRDPNDPLERRAQVQDRLDRPRNGNRTKEQHHRCGRVRGSNRPKLMKSRHSQNKATSNTGIGIPNTSCSIKSHRTSAMSAVSS